MTGAILIAVALAALLLAQFVYYLALYQGRRRQAELKRRLRSLGGSEVRPGISMLRERRIARGRLLARLLAPLPGSRALESLLLQTELHWTVATVYAVTILFAVGAAGAVWLALHNPLLAIAAGLLALPLPLLIVHDARGRRDRKLSMQLPDALDMMARSLRAGHGLAGAMRLCAEEMPLPVALELGRCFEEQRLGVSHRDAVRDMALRVPGNMDLRMFAVSVIVQSDTGGNLVEILEQLSATIRERFKFYGKLRALTIEAKLSGIVLSILPFLCLAIIALIRPKYLAPLAEDPLGRVFVIAGLALWAIGAFSMRRLARVDY